MFNNEINEMNIKAADKKVKKTLPKSKHLKNTKINQLVGGGGQGSAASGTTVSFICTVCATC